MGRRRIRELQELRKGALQSIYANLNRLPEGLANEIRGALTANLAEELRVLEQIGVNPALVPDWQGRLRGLQIAQTDFISSRTAEPIRRNLLDALTGLGNVHFRMFRVAEDEVKQTGFAANPLAPRERVASAAAARAPSPPREEGQPREAPAPPLRTLSPQEQPQFGRLAPAPRVPVGSGPPPRVPAVSEPTRVAAGPELTRGAAGLVLAPRRDEPPARVETPAIRAETPREPARAEPQRPATSTQGGATPPVREASRPAGEAARTAGEAGRTAGEAGEGDSSSDEEEEEEGVEEIPEARRQLLERQRRVAAERSETERFAASAGVQGIPPSDIDRLQADEQRRADAEAERRRREAAETLEATQLPVSEEFRRQQLEAQQARARAQARSGTAPVAEQPRAGEIKTPLLASERAAQEARERERKAAEQPQVQLRTPLPLSERATQAASPASGPRADEPGELVSFGASGVSGEGEGGAAPDIAPIAGSGRVRPTAGRGRNPRAAPAERKVEIVAHARHHEPASGPEPIDPRRVGTLLGEANEAFEAVNQFLDCQGDDCNSEAVVQTARSMDARVAELHELRRDQTDLKCPEAAAGAEKLRFLGDFTEAPLEDIGDVLNYILLHHDFKTVDAKRQALRELRNITECQTSVLRYKSANELMFETDPDTKDPTGRIVEGDGSGASCGDGGLSFMGMCFPKTGDCPRPGRRIDGDGKLAGLCIPADNFRETKRALDEWMSLSPVA